jgi:hypothetical protein
MTASSAPTCFNCGYSIASLGTSELCPECGLPALDTRDVLDGHSAAARDDRSCQHCCVGLAITAILGVFMYACSTI